MSLNTFRSFAIYLAIAIIISESPVSAFTVVRSKTTTLKTSLDLVNEESALVEVKHDIPKINVKENTKEKFSSIGTGLPPTRTNTLDEDKKATISSKLVVTSATDTPFDGINISKLTEDASVNKPDAFSRNQDFNSTNNENNGKATEEQSSISSITEPFSTQSYSTTELLSKEKEVSTINQTKANKNEQLTTVTNEVVTWITNSAPLAETTLETTTNLEKNVQSTSSGISETTLPNTDVDIRQTLNTEDVVTEPMKIQSKNKSINTQSKEDVSTTLSADVTELQTQSPSTEKEGAVTNTTGLTETMMSEASSYATNIPVWKTYTTIDRKRITRIESDPTTDKTEELTRAETVTIQDAVSTTPISHENKELMKTAASQNSPDPTSSVSTEKISSKGDTKKNQVPSTAYSEPNTKATLDYIESKRAGFLDLSAKQSSSEESTEKGIDVSYNKTKRIGSALEADTRDGKSPVKQSQMVEDAIKEELLKEQVLSDRVNSNSVNNANSEEDSLSVKPIPSKGIYTVSSNYKPMKKIEVQPLKPFIRDPDDNSWRNESLSSLGIVFKAKNASKPFTQVLKNKTEAELNNLTEKYDKNEVPDLRERLEKIAEVRKSRKKKINKNGDTVYTDYEEGTSGESPSTPKSIFDEQGRLNFIDFSTIDLTTISSTEGINMDKDTTTRKPKKKINKYAEYYDSNDEYDVEYINLSKIDLKKFTTQQSTKGTTSTASPLWIAFTKPTYLPDRKPTLQYFPPRDPPRIQKVNMNEYDGDFQNKINMFTPTEAPKRATQPLVSEISTTEHRPSPGAQPTAAPVDYTRDHKPANLDRNLYVTFPSQVGDPVNKYTGGNDESFNRASFVIKHYKDLIDEAVKSDYDRNGEYITPYTETPLVGVTTNKDRKPLDTDYDYEENFRKDILNRFVDNFNQNAERFKVDFPVLYNNSVVHSRAQENGKVAASSSAFLKRQYGDAPLPPVPPLAAHPPSFPAKPCTTSCDVRVDLSPAYELHYYVPEQEEKEIAEPKPTLPYNYRL